MAAIKKTATKKGGSRKKADKPQAEVSPVPEARDDKPVMIASRVHPRLQYGLRLLSRVQGGTIGEALEWAINLAMRQTRIGSGEGETRLNRIVDAVWAYPTEPRKIAFLNRYAPELLDFEQRATWNLVVRCADLWLEQTLDHIPDNYDKSMSFATFDVDGDKQVFMLKAPRFDLIEKDWKTIQRTGVLLGRVGEIEQRYTLDEIRDGTALKRAGIDTPY